MRTIRLSTTRFLLWLARKTALRGGWVVTMRHCGEPTAITDPKHPLIEWDEIMFVMNR